MGGQIPSQPHAAKPRCLGTKGVTCPCRCPQGGRGRDVLSQRGRTPGRGGHPQPGLSQCEVDGPSGCRAVRAVSGPEGADPWQEAAPALCALSVKPCRGVCSGVICPPALEEALGGDSAARKAQVIRAGQISPANQPGERLPRQACGMQRDGVHFAIAPGSPGGAPPSPAQSQGPPAPLPAAPPLLPPACGKLRHEREQESGTIAATRYLSPLGASMKQTTPSSW